MYILMVRLKVKAEKIEEFIKESIGDAEGSVKNEPGCRRFDIIQENRVSFIKIFKELKKSPKKILNLFPSFLESMIVSAELAKFNVNGIKGSIRLKGLFIIYFITFYTWVEDTTFSLEKTMNALDKNLDHAEKFGKFLN